MCLGYIIYCFSYYAVNGIRSYRLNGYFWDKADSIFYKKDTSKFDYKLLFLICLRGTSMTACEYLYIAIVYTAKLAQINLAALLSLG